MKKEELKAAPPEGISRSGKKIIGIGIFFVAAGFCILTRTDPQGQNWASLVSPFLIVGGYITIAIGIIFPASRKQ